MAATACLGVPKRAPSGHRRGSREAAPSPRRGDSYRPPGPHHFSYSGAGGCARPAVACRLPPGRARDGGALFSAALQSDRSAPQRLVSCPAVATRFRRPRQAEAGRGRHATPSAHRPINSTPSIRPFLGGGCGCGCGVRTGERPGKVRGRAAAVAGLRAASLPGRKVPAVRATCCAARHAPPRPAPRPRGVGCRLLPPAAARPGPSLSFQVYRGNSRRGAATRRHTGSTVSLQIRGIPRQSPSRLVSRIDAPSAPSHRPTGARGARGSRPS